MSLDKAIEHGKEKRKPYTDSRAIFGSCRNHGTCWHCNGNRLYRSRRLEQMAREKYKDFNEETIKKSN